MKTLLVLATIAFSFQLYGAGTITVGYPIVWGYGWTDGRIQCSTNLITVDGQELDNIVAGYISPNDLVVLLKSDGVVSSWGHKNGLVDIPSGLNNATAIAVGSRYGLALLNNGTINAWGDGQNGKTKVPNNATNVVAIATGEESCVAVRRDGLAIGWGQNQIPTGLGNVKTVAMSTLMSGRNLALKCDGTVVEWRNRNPASLHSIEGLSNVVSIAVSPVHNLALKNDGTVFAWGNSLFGETNVPVGLNNVVAIAVGGFRNEGMSGFGYSLALKKDGTVAAWGVMGFNNQPVIVPEGLSHVVAIAAGNNYCLAITTDPAIAKKFRKK